MRLRYNLGWSVTSANVHFNVMCLYLSFVTDSNNFCSSNKCVIKGKNEPSTTTYLKHIRIHLNFLINTKAKPKRHLELMKEFVNYFYILSICCNCNPNIPFPVLIRDQRSFTIYLILLSWWCYTYNAKMIVIQLRFVSDRKKPPEQRGMKSTKEEKFSGRKLTFFNQF